MKKNKLLSLIVASGILLSSAVSYAATTSTTFDVTTTVVGSCSVVATGIDFGDITGGEQSDVYGSGDITVNCTDTLSYNIALDAGQNFGAGAGVPDRYVSNAAGTGFIQLGIIRPSSVGGGRWGDAGFGDTIDSSPVPGTGTGVPQSYAVDGLLVSPSVTLVGVLTPGEIMTDVVNVTVHF